MIKKLNGLTILFILTVVMVLLMVVTIYNTHDDSDDYSLLYPGLFDKLSSVDSLQFKSTQGDFTIKKEGDQWTIPKRWNYPADYDEVKRILIDISHVKILEHKTADPSKYAVLGVEDPSKAKDDNTLQINMMHGDKMVAGIIIGKQRDIPTEVGPRQFYVRKVGGKKSWLVQGYLQISPVMLNWVQNQIMDINRERIARVDIIQPNGDTATLINLDKNQFGTPESREKTVFKYQELGYDIAGTLNQLRMEDVQPLKGFSRGEAEVVKAVFTTYDGLKITAKTSFNDGFYYSTFHADFDPDAIKTAPKAIQADDVLESKDEVKKEVAKLNKQLSPWVYRVSSFIGTNLMRAKSDIVTNPDKQIPMPANYGGFGPNN